MQKYKYRSIIQFIDLSCDRKAYKYDRELFVLEIKEEMSDWRRIMYKCIYDRLVEEYEKEEKIDLIY